MDAMISVDFDEIIPTATEHGRTNDLSALEGRATDALKKLSDKRRKFVRGLLAGHSNGKSYILAGYKASTPTTAYSSAYQLLRIPQVNYALECAREFQIMRDGIPEVAKKQHLWKLAKVTADEDNPNFNARASIAAVHEVNLMDGGHAAKWMDVSGNVGITIDYALVIPGGRNPLEGEVVEVPDETAPGKLVQPPKPR